MLRLAALRRSRGISQAALAEMIGVNECTIVRWEKGRSKPNTKFIPDLCKALNVSLEELWSIKEG